MFQHFGKRHHQELSIRKRQRLFTNVRGHKPALILPKGLVVCIAMTVRPSGSVHARPPDLRQQRRRGKQQVSERAAHFQTLAARVRAQNRLGHRQNHRYAPHVWPEHPIGVHSEIRVRYVLRRVLQLAQTSPNNGLDGLFDFRSVHKVLCAGALKACQTPANRSTWISTASIARAEHDSTAIPVADRMALYLFSVPSVLLVSAPSVLSLIFSALCTKPAFGHAFPDSGIQKTRYLTRTPPMHAKKSLDIRYTDMIVSAVLPRQIISQYPPRQSNPFLIRQLQPLCPLFSSPAFCFQSFAASFSETPGVGVPPHIRPSLRFRRHMRHVAPLSLWPQSIAHTSCSPAVVRIPTGHPPTCFGFPSFAADPICRPPAVADPLFSFLTNCFSRNLFLFITIHIAGGW